MKNLKQLLMVPLFLGLIGTASSQEGLAIAEIDKPEDGQSLRIGLNELIEFKITALGDRPVPSGEYEIGIIANGYTDTAALNFEDAIDAGDTTNASGFLPISADVPVGTGEYCLFVVDEGTDTVCVSNIEFENIEIDLALTGMEPENEAELKRSEPVPFNVTVSNLSENNLHGPVNVPLFLFFLDLDDFDPEEDDLTEENILNSQQVTFSLGEGDVIEGGQEVNINFGELTIPEESPGTMAIMVQISMSQAVDPNMENNTIIHTYSTVSSLADIDNFDNHLTVYPNPASSYQNITIEAELENVADVSLEVYDLNGKQVYSKDAVEFVPGKNAITIEGDTLDSGLYIYRLNDGENHIDGKIVVE